MAAKIEAGVAQALPRVGRSERGAALVWVYIARSELAATLCAVLCGLWRGARMRQPTSGPGDVSAPRGPAHEGIISMGSTDRNRLVRELLLEVSVRVACLRLLLAIAAGSHTARAMRRRVREADVQVAVVERDPLAARGLLNQWERS